MKIAMYYPWVYLKAGPERTMIELIRRSRHDWTIFTSHYDREGTFPEFKQMDLVELKRVSVKRRYGAVIKAATRIASTKLDLASYDALVISCDGLGSLINFRNAAKPIACLCFTPLRAVYDEAYRERHLKKYRRLKPLCLAFEALYRMVDRPAWKRYSHVFCISETVKKRVLRGRLCNPQDISIAYPGIDGDEIAYCDTREPFFFLPGRIMWTKNIELGVEAFLKCKGSDTNGHKLVIAGMVDHKSQPYFQRLQQMAGGRSDIDFVQDPTDDQMRQLYKTCYATLFTAFNEDWGLTPIEGMMRGKPVIAVNRGGPTETVVHNETGLLAPADSDAFCDAMTQLIADPDRVESMGKKAVERAKRFTWTTFVDHVDSCLDQIAAGVATGASPVK